MVENDKVVDVLTTKLKMPMMNIFRKFSDYEDLRMKIAESTIISCVLCQYHPQIDTPENPQVKLHANLCDAESVVLCH